MMRKILLFCIGLALITLISILFSTHWKKIATSCPGHSDVEEIRSNPSAIRRLFEECKPKMAFLFREFSSSELFSIYSMEVAYQMAPYGANDALTIPQILAADHLSCEAYAKLMIYWNQFNPDPPKIFYVVWEGGVYDAHVQVSTCNTDRCLALDPTVNVMAKTNVLELAHGHRIDGRQVFDLSSKPELVDATNLVIASMVYGRLRPADLRAYVLQEWSTVSHVSPWIRVEPNFSIQRIILRGKVFYVSSDAWTL